MLKSLKWFLILTAAFVGLLLTLLVVLNNIDLNRFNPFIENKVTEYTGRQFKINGDLQLHLSLNPSLIIKKS